MSFNIKKSKNCWKIAENAVCERAVLYQRKHPKDTFSKGKIAGKEHYGINMKTGADIITAKGTKVKRSPFGSAGLLYL